MPYARGMVQLPKPEPRAHLFGPSHRDRRSHLRPLAQIEIAVAAPGAALSIDLDRQGASTLFSETSMRRTLVASLALFVAVSAPAAAQTCLGLASHSAGPMQVTGNASFTDLANSVGGTFGYGLPSGVFGKAGVATTSYDAVGSAIDLGAQAGYEMSLGKASQVSVCPVASFAIGMGPKDIDAVGTDFSSRQGTVGVSVGTSMNASPRMRIVPNAGMALAYRRDKLQQSAGYVDFSDTYALASVGVGLVVNSNISLRPSVSIPLGSDFSNDPTFGLTVGMNFGSKR